MEVMGNLNASHSSLEISLTHWKSHKYRAFSIKNSANMA